MKMKNSLKRTIFYFRLKKTIVQMGCFYIKYIIYFIYKKGEISMKKVEKQVFTNSKVKLLLFITFILSILSIFIALAIVAISVEKSPLPEFPLTMVEHMWKFYLMIPLPLLSTVLGIIFINRKYKCKKNLIAGIITLILLCIFGSFTSVFAKQISHDSSYLNELSNRVSINFPHDSYISITFNLSDDCDFLVMIKIQDSFSRDFINQLESGNNWKKDTSHIPSNVLDIYTLAVTQNYDYFTVFNETKTVYNDFDGKLIYMAFDIETNVMYVYSFKE